MAVETATIKNAIAQNYYYAMVDLPKDADEALHEAIDRESSEEAEKVLENMLENIKTSREEGLSLCQDNGVNEHFVRVGSEFELADGVKLRDAMEEGIELATDEIPLRPTVVHPLTRENLGDNTNVRVPLLHFDYVEGSDAIEITTIPKGFGSENQSRLAMLTPADGVEGIKKFVLQSVKEAGGKACPPFTVGVGVGGTFNEVTALAKKASALRWCGAPNSDSDIADLEQELLEDINETGIGPMGIGGDTTAVAVHIEEAGTHIAGNPVAVNLMCHPRRRSTVRIENDNSYEFRDRFEGTDHEDARVKSPA